MPRFPRLRPADLANILMSVGSLAFAALTILPVPNALLWKARIVATEAGHYLLSLVLVSLLPIRWRQTSIGQWGARLRLIAAIFFSRPLIQALWLIGTGTYLRTGTMTLTTPPRQQPDAPARPAPLVIRDLLLGVCSPPVQCQTLTYHACGLDLDIYRPFAPTEPLPIVVVLHPGAWQFYDKTIFAQAHRYLAARGYAVAALNFRQAPAHRFPAPCEDITAAIAYLKAHAQELGLDPARIVLLGRSSGGHLALFVGYTAHDPAIRGVVSFYGPGDLHYSYAHPVNPHVLDIHAVLYDFLGGSPTEMPERYTAASPITFVGPMTPPTLLIHGERDEVVLAAQGKRLAARLHREQRPYALLTLPWASHAADFELRSPFGQISTYVVERFLAEVV